MNTVEKLFQIFDIQKLQNTILIIILFSFTLFLNYSFIFKNTGFLPQTENREKFIKSIKEYEQKLERLPVDAIYRVQPYNNGIVENNLHLMITDSTERATLTLFKKVILPTLIAVVFWTFLIVSLLAHYAIDNNNSLITKKEKLLKAFKYVAPILFIIYAITSGINIADFAKYGF